VTSIVQPSADTSGGHEHFRLRIEGFGVGTWDLDLATLELEWSDAARSLFGVPRGQAITYEAFLALLEPKDRERTERDIKRATAGSGGFDISFKVSGPNGRGQWVRARAGLIKDEAGVPRHLSGIFLDAAVWLHRAGGRRQECQRADAGARSVTP
jgi:two-component system sensor kinase FixL